MQDIINISQVREQNLASEIINHALTCADLSAEWRDGRVRIQISFDDIDDMIAYDIPGSIYNNYLRGYFKAMNEPKQQNIKLKTKGAKS